jgi:glycosyltransferase involved in cell wall biosynthesis
MHVLCVIDNLNSGGAQRQLVTLATGLYRKGHQVEFFVYHPQDFFAQTLSDLNITIHRHYKRSRFSTDVVAALLRVLQSHRYDVMVSFLKTPNFYAETARLLAGSAGPKLVVSERNGDSSNSRNFNTKALRQFHRLADHITVNSHHQRRALEAKYRWLRPKTSTIYNGVDLDIFHPEPAPQPNNGPCRFLALASVVERKNGLRLIQALHIAREKYHITPVVHWIGEHQMHLADRKKASLQWQEEVKRLHLEKQWHWFPPRNDVPQLMRSYDALIHPSYLEGLPNAVCEAMASGLPILVSNTLDHPLMVQDGVSGFLFDPFAAESIAESLFRFSSLPPAARRQMGLAARSYAERELALATYVDHYEALFLKMLSGPMPRQAT